MHEFSLTRSLCAQVAEIVRADGGGTVREIRVRCGPLSGVEPLLMREAFAILRREGPMAEAELRIIEEGLSARCDGCGRTFEPENFCFVCPHCGSPKTTAVSGDAVVIESVVVDSAEADDPSEAVDLFGDPGDIETAGIQHTGGGRRESRDDDRA